MSSEGIRNIVQQSNVTYKDVAAELNITGEHLSRLLKKDLPLKREVEIIEAIYKVVKRNRG